LENIFREYVHFYLEVSAHFNKFRLKKNKINISYRTNFILRMGINTKTECNTLDTMFMLLKREDKNRLTVFIFLILD